MDNDQAIYNAVCSRISNGNVGEVVADVARQCLDTSSLQQQIQSEAYQVSASLQRPSVLYRPALSMDGNRYCALYGENIQEGCAGFGPSPELAMMDFDRNWSKPI